MGDGADRYRGAHEPAGDAAEALSDLQALDAEGPERAAGVRAAGEVEDCGGED